MSQRSVDELAGTAPRWAVARALGGLALGGALALASIAGVVAQGTPETGMMASPASGECVAPAADTSALASPAADAADAAATPGDAALLDEAVAAATNFANCWNAGDLTGVLASVTPNLLQTLFNVADAAEAEALLGGFDLPPISILETGDGNTYDDGRASLDITYLLGDYQYVDAQWFMVRAGDALLIDEEELQVPQPEGDTIVIGFSVADDTQSVALTGATEVPAAPVIALEGTNSGAERHVFTLTRSAGDGATPVADMAGGEFVGTLTIAPGESENMALVGLEPGTYVLSDDAVEGSTATLTVTEPAV